MRSKLIATLVIALAIPSLALAAKPPAPGKSTAPHGNSQSAPKVMYVLKGTLTSATGTPVTAVTIHVLGANYHASALKGTNVTVATSSATKFVYYKGATSLGVGHKVVVKFRAVKKIVSPATLATVIAGATAFQVVDQGPAS